MTGNGKSIIYNIAVKTRPGALPGKPVKTNQDSYIIKHNLLGNPEYGFYCVCDGHGLHGHLVSSYVKKLLPSKFMFNIFYRIRKN